MQYPKPVTVKKPRKTLGSRQRAEWQAEKQARPAMHLPDPLRGQRGVITRISVEVQAVPKAPKPVRDEEYRRLVAGLECFHCRIHGHSQAAHPNSGKAKGVKLDDLDCFPMCTVGGKDCHVRFDQYKLVPKGEEMQAFERAAKHWTVRELLHRGLWPARLAIPDLRYFQ